MEKIINHYTEFLLDKFISYVKIHTTSDENSTTQPSTPVQLDLARLLKQELEIIGLKDVILDDKGFVYGIMPANTGETGKDFSLAFCAHMDTSSSVPGNDVKPLIHKNYDGKEIELKAGNITLSSEDSPLLEKYRGRTVITSSGDTLLGADDKAGIIEIITGLKILAEHPEIPHPELRIIFTPDEEIGAGTVGIDEKRFGTIGYTFDGGEEGEIEDECFDAYGVKFEFFGKNVHPGTAKNKMVNAVRLASKYFSEIPENEVPETTELREGFFHLLEMSGDETHAQAKMIIRDFENEKNLKRLEYLDFLKNKYETYYPGLKINILHKHQYQNMKEVLKNYPDTVDKAIEAIKSAGLSPKRIGIRGGTDGARLSFMGMPTPNIFTGGHLFHSLKEWITLESMEKAVYVFLNLCKLWAEI